MNQGGTVKQPAAGENFWEKYENAKDVSPVNKLCQVQVAENYGSETWDPCANRLNSQWFYSFL